MTFQHQKRFNRLCALFRTGANCPFETTLGQTRRESLNKLFVLLGKKVSQPIHWRPRIISRIKREIPVSPSFDTVRIVLKMAPPKNNVLIFFGGVFLGGLFCPYLPESSVLIISRRDLAIGERIFSQFGQPMHLKISIFSTKKRQRKN